MNIHPKHQKTKCPACGSKSIHTQSLDQICLDCDWTNMQMLVDLGQMDRLILAAHQHFISPLSFEDLKNINSQNSQSRTDLDTEASA